MSGHPWVGQWPYSVRAPTLFCLSAASAGLKAYRVYVAPCSNQSLTPVETNRQLFEVTPDPFNAGAVQLASTYPDPYSGSSGSGCLAVCNAPDCNELFPSLGLSVLMTHCWSREGNWDGGRAVFSLAEVIGRLLDCAVVLMRGRACPDAFGG